jgi:hypothetical protein
MGPLRPVTMSIGIRSLVWLVCPQSESFPRLSSCSLRWFLLPGISPCIAETDAGRYDRKKFLDQTSVRGIDPGVVSSSSCGLPFITSSCVVATSPTIPTRSPKRRSCLELRPITAVIPARIHCLSFCWPPLRNGNREPRLKFSTNFPWNPLLLRLLISRKIPFGCHRRCIGRWECR